MRCPSRAERFVLGGAWYGMRAMRLGVAMLEMRPDLSIGGPGRRFGGKQRLRQHRAGE